MEDGGWLPVKLARGDFGNMTRSPSPGPLPLVITHIFFAAISNLLLCDLATPGWTNA